MLQDFFTFGARHRLVTLLILLAATLLAASGAVKLRIDTSYDKLISDHDPGWDDYKRIVKEFGSDNTTIVFLRDANLFTPAKLALIDKLVGDLEADPEIERVDSLYSAPNIRDVDGTLETGRILDSPPEDKAEADVGRKKALHSPLVARNLLNGDGTVTAVNISLKRHAADRDFNKAMYESIEAKLVPIRGAFEQVFQIGPPRLNVEIEKGMYRDLSTFMPLSTLILVATVYFFLRTWTACVVPLATAGLSIFWTLGFMGWADIPLTLLTTLVPALNIVIGSAEDTHMMSTYLRAIATQTKPDRQAAIRFMTSHISIALLLTSSTTVIGFASDALYDIPIMIEFAFAAAFALTANFFATVLLMPLLLATIGPTTSKLAPQSELPHGMMGVFVNWLERFGRERRKLILVVAAVIAALSVYFATGIKVSNDPLSYFRASSPLVKDAGLLHERLAGMQLFYVTLESKSADGFSAPDPLKRAETIERLLRDEGVFDSVLSLPDLVALVNREMNQGAPDFWKVPDTQPLIEQYLLLLKRTDIDRYASANLRSVNIVVRHNLSDSSAFNAILAKLEPKIRAAAGPAIEVKLVGKNLMVNRSAEGLIENQADSLVWVILVILVLMALLYQSILAGLVSMIPNVIPIAICFGTMGLLGIPLNPGTASVAAVALGIAVDDTIHFFSSYLQACRHEPDPDKSISDTLRGESIPVIATTVALALGFVILVFSNFTIVAQYGALSAYTMIVAVFTDLFLTPALLRGVRLVGLWDVLAARAETAVLKKSPLFEGMSPRAIKKAVLLSTLDQHKAGATIVAEGEEKRSMYLVLSGTAEVRHQDKLIRTLAPGDIFGEVGYVGAAKRTATVRALEDVELLVLDAATSRQATLMHPFISNRLSLNISRILGQRLAEATAKGA
ncbi:MAG: MMPL family transporter [Rhodospirillales bacterium]|nr:MMPL family transporter [Rhodospirillales bacterium]